MSRTATVSLKCWDGEYTFRLGINELITLQEKCDAGPGFIMNRIGSGHWRVKDITETLRLGLVGAGTSQEAARVLIEQHVERIPLIDNIPNAHAVLVAAIMGVDDEELGKP